MLDYKRYKGRPMPFEEQVASVRKDIDFGAALGMPFIRSLVSIDPITRRGSSRPLARSIPPPSLVIQ